MLALLSSTIFKLGMLPSMTATLMGNDCILTVFLLCLIDSALICLTFFIAKQGGIVAILAKYKKQKGHTGENGEKQPIQNHPNHGEITCCEPTRNSIEANEKDEIKLQHNFQEMFPINPPATEQNNDEEKSTFKIVEETISEKEKRAQIPLWAKIFILTPLCIFFMIKTIIYSSEIISYTSERLFDGIKWVVIVISIVPVVFLIGKKKLHVLGRLGQISLWLIAVALLFNLIFNTFQLKIENILPLGISGGSILTSPFRFMWYAGDCLPLLFACFTPCENDISDSRAYFSTLLLPIIVSLYFGLCVITYGNALSEVSDIFSRLALFNSISDDLGAFDLPFVASWLAMAMLTISLYCYGIRHSAREATGRNYAYPLITIALAVILSLYVENYGNIEKLFVFSPYFILGSASIILVSIIFVLTRIAMKKTKKENADDSRTAENIKEKT